MDHDSRRQEHRDNVLSSLDVAIEALNLAEKVSSITPAKAAFGSVGALLAMIRDSAANDLEYIELGLSCADICKALERGMNGKSLDDVSQSVCDAIGQLTTTVAEIQSKVIRQGGRHALSRVFHARGDKEKIAGWKSDLNRILVIFNTELIMNTHTIVADMRRDMLKSREDTDGQSLETQNSIFGESPPPPPRACFGRGELIEEIIGLAENLTPIALIGTGGIGKTSTALTVLHDDRIKRRFGDNRRFIRCDQFLASRAHFLRRLSKVTGAGIENPEDLNPLRSFLSSNEMIILLDNAEPILDPQGTSAQEIYAVVEELSQFGNICLCITSRISTVPPDCKTLDIPTLSMEAARDAFYRIYEHEKSDPVNKILEQLDFHPLSLTLLATVAQHNKWDANRLAREWERRRTGMLHTQHSKSLAATIEMSLASPIFQRLGPEARGLLGVVAFFPQGVNENNVGWLFPTTPDITNIFDTFCVLSLTYRTNGFITMLAPLRDHLRPKDPKSSQLLSMTKGSYFTRLSVDLYPDKPGFGEARWITSEDVNAEHLLDIFASIDMDSGEIWDACASFVRHLYWHKRRVTTLGPKIEGLPDDHRSKPGCLCELSELLYSIGSDVECKRLLTHTLKLHRERGSDNQVAQTLVFLAEAHRRLGFYEEGVQLGKEASEIYERLSDTVGHARCLSHLAWSLYADGQLDAAEAAASRAINLLPEDGEQFLVCQCHRILGEIHHAKGDTEGAIGHFEAALGIASSFSWHPQLFWIHFSLASIFSDKEEFDDADAHIERAKSHTVNHPYHLGRAMDLQAWFWYNQRRFEEAKSEALRAAEVFKKLGATRDLEDCERLLRDIDSEQSE